MPQHDFERSIEAAREDDGLRAQLQKYLKSYTLAAVEGSDLIKPTWDAVNLVINAARDRYATAPDRLVSVIVASETPNAYAIWSESGRDWVVLTTGLLDLLRDRADAAASRYIEEFPEVFRSPLAKRILTKRPLGGGFQATIGSLLYVAGVGFFAGVLVRAVSTFDGPFFTIDDGQT
jgi:hypothetical protein